MTDTVVGDVTGPITFTMADETEVTLPWMVMVPASTVFGNSTACLADPSVELQTDISGALRHDMVHDNKEGVTVTRASLHNARGDDRTVVISPDSP